MTIQLERSSRHDDLMTLINGRASGYSLEAPFYTSQDFFDLDMSAIFTKHWLFVAAEAELPEPGDFVTVEVGPSSVIIVRDDDEEVRAFHNVCRHRGSRILDEERGSVGNLVCPYHHWTYRVDGSLRHADNQPTTFDRSRFGLKPVQCAALAAWCSSASLTSPRPTSTTWRRASSRTSLPTSWGVRRSRTKSTSSRTATGSSSWRTTVSATTAMVTPELISAYFPLHGYTAEDVPPRLRRAWERFEKATADLQAACVRQGFPLDAMRELDTRPTGFMISHAPLDGAGKSYTAGGESVCRKRVGSIVDDRFGDMHLHLQPNSWFHMLSDHAVVFTVLPIAPDKTFLRSTWLVHADAVEGVDYDVPTLTHVWSATNAQDSAFVARTQRGVEDPGYQPGPYSEVEGDVEAFVNWYISRVRAHLSR